MSTPSRPAEQHERGSAVIELTILAPAIVLLMLLVVLAGRITLAQNDVHAAASDAARAASLRQHAGSAASHARATAARSLANRGVTCASLAVDTNARRLTPGGEVGVRVRCTVDLRDLTGLGVPGSRTIAAHVSEAVDRFRSR